MTTKTKKTPKRKQPKSKDAIYTLSDCEQHYTSGWNVGYAAGKWRILEDMGIWKYVQDKLREHYPDYFNEHY